jgi:hypothetical protein
MRLRTTTLYQYLIYYLIYCVPNLLQGRRLMHEAAHNNTVTILAENDLIGKLFDTHAGE